MEIWGSISPGSIVHRIVKVLFFCAFGLLPWINTFRLATFLFLTLGGIMLVFHSKLLLQAWRRDINIVFALFFTYYLLNIIALAIFPHNQPLHYDVERKAPLLVIPLLLSATNFAYSGLWKTGIMGLIYGCIVAAIFCFGYAIKMYVSTNNISFFFYHTYAMPTGLSAIYLSLFLLVALGYIILNPFTGKISPLMKIAGGFLYFNLILLSSKILIITGSILLLIPVWRFLRSGFQKAAMVILSCSVCFILIVTKNPIKDRYTNLDFKEYSKIFNINDFTNFPFDGLSIRLTLWRIGNELVNAYSNQIWGFGGERYHDFLRDKIMSYHLYTGSVNTSDTGYLMYNMHCQYMESYVQFGAIGVGILLFALCYALYYAIQYWDPMLLFVILLFSIAFITESVLERQAGIILFISIISGEWIQLQNKVRKALN